MTDLHDEAEVDLAAMGAILTDCQKALAEVERERDEARARVAAVAEEAAALWPHVRVEGGREMAALLAYSGRIKALARPEETDALAERDARMFDLGFAYSAEGWNGEYPGDAHLTEHYRGSRAAAIREDKT